MLLNAADKKLVGLEMDVMWVSVAGVDPVALLAKYGSRVDLMHLKDVEKSTAQRFDEGIPRTAFREVGKGRVDFPAVLRAAKKAGVKHYFVEQDQTAGNPLDSLRESFAYLDALSL